VSPLRSEKGRIYRIFRLIVFPDPDIDHSFPVSKQNRGQGEMGGAILENAVKSIIYFDRRRWCYM
jgi:hypothetical protein